MDQQSTSASPTNGASTPHDLFVLTDEQILGIEPKGEVNLASGLPARLPDGQANFSPASSPARARGAAAPGDELHPPSVILSEPQATEASQLNSNGDSSGHKISRDATAQPGVTVLPEPPPWLAAQMKDPWSGEEAKEFWNGVQQARSEAAAYRAAFASPEDARALKELYPGGVNEARGAAGRARLLDEIDRAYFGAAGGSAEKTSAARADLAQLMLREDPAAFREMVFAGLRALEAAEKGSTGAASASNLPRLANIFSASGTGVNVAPPFRAAPSATTGSPSAQDAGLKPSATLNSHESPVASHESLTAAYASFERAANEDLERSVGATITRTIEQALPNLQRSNRGEREGARQGVPLQERLSAAVRQDVEATLKGDRQLGEQIAQILSARRFDNETRAQVVRLIDDRARQLVPSAARRVINDWTQTTLAAHRGNASRFDAASARREAEPVATQGPVPRGESARWSGQQPDSAAAVSSRAAQTRPGARRLDYRKLSDEQILEL